EPALAVAELALIARERHGGHALTLEARHGDERIGDLLPVGADVLDRGRTNRAGDSRKAFDAPPPRPRRSPDHRVPIPPPPRPALHPRPRLAESPPAHTVLLP